MTDVVLLLLAFFFSPTVFWSFLVQHCTCLSHYSASDSVTSMLEEPVFRKHRISRAKGVLSRGTLGGQMRLFFISRNGTRLSVSREQAERR